MGQPGQRQTEERTCWQVRVRGDIADILSLWVCSPNLGGMFASVAAAPSVSSASSFVYKHPRLAFLSGYNRENNGQLAWAARGAQTHPIDFKLKSRHSTDRTHVSCRRFSFLLCLSPGCVQESAIICTTVWGPAWWTPISYPKSCGRLWRSCACRSRLCVCESEQLKWGHVCCEWVLGMGEQGCCFRS